MENREPKYLSVRGMQSLIMILGCIIINFAFSKLASGLGLPLYLDNIGTLMAAILGGYLPGIITAIFTNTVNYFIDDTSIYYAALSALIAITATVMSRRGKFKNVIGYIQLIAVIALIGGGMGSVITLFLHGVPTEGIVYDLMQTCSDVLRTKTFGSFFLVSILMDMIDKTITVLISVAFMQLIPKEKRKMLWLYGWRQAPMPDEEVKAVYRSAVTKTKLSSKFAMALIISSALIAAGIIYVSATIFSDFSRTHHERLAGGLATLVADSLDPDMIDTYMEEGEAAPGYKETEALLYDIRNSSDDIEYVYVYDIQEDGCHVVFDLDTDELKGEEPGTVVPFDESFMSQVPKLLAGEPIDPVESNDTYGWLFTVYKPVYDSNGECKCYAAVDIAVTDMNSYVRQFIVKIILLFLGFFILILFTGIWLANYQIVLPINSIAARANDFAYGTGDIEDADDTILDENLEKIRSLEIRTGDEVEYLYDAFVKMTEDSVAYTKNMKEQSEAISELQRGLIMTMADMVEGRDSDTGNHIRKTAAYARIIMDGLREKGYYSDQLTDKFIHDVERSAPLHDIGKISISDVILNKPGKLTDEEFEIMKTHTTAGKELLDKVIETVNGESYLDEGRKLAAYHHEKWNGTGYPESLAGEDIPLSARIMAIADVFDAISSKRCYKDAMPFDKAVSIIKEDSGKHFDPKCAEAFLDNIDRVKEVLDYYNALEAEGENVRGREKQQDN